MGWKCWKKDFVTVGRGDKQRKISTKNKTDEEIQKEVAAVKLELSDYKSVSSLPHASPSLSRLLSLYYMLDR